MIKDINMQQWLVTNKKADFKAIGEKFQIDQVTARIIRNRDVIEEDDIRKFLSVPTNAIMSITALTSLIPLYPLFSGGLISARSSA